MANPKRRFSNQRTDKRRANWKLEAPSVMKCPSCGAEKLPHNVCPSCGMYNGKQIVKMEEAE
jgi:large subunit ribosomal protein L32